MPTPNQPDILSILSKEQGQNLFTQAKTQYPYLADKNIAYDYSPGKGSGFLEFYPPGEEGTKEEPRPKNIPLDQVGIQVRSTKTRPIDILADYVSHHAVNVDPKLQQPYQQFSKSLDPAMMQKRYQWSVQNEGEKRPFDQWAQASGIPSMFRGYTFGQWSPQDVKRMYSPEQLKILDTVRQYLGVK
jgi:hypothetical protein